VLNRNLNMKQPTILAVLGTRPEAIPMAPVIALLKNDPTFKVTVPGTGRHSDPLDPTFGLLGVRPDIDLGRRIGAR
jgi:UDP-N-acetylglucosamine 2-epimerase (non-hydrolysing)